MSAQSVHHEPSSGGWDPLGYHVLQATPAYRIAVEFSHSLFAWTIVAFHHTNLLFQIS